MKSRNMWEMTVMFLLLITAFSVAMIISAQEEEEGEWEHVEEELTDDAVWMCRRAQQNNE